MRVYLITFAGNYMSYLQVRRFLEIKGTPDIKASDVQWRFKTLIFILNINTKTQESNCTFLALKLLGLSSPAGIIEQKWFGFVLILWIFPKSFDFFIFVNLDKVTSVK